jgi:N-acetyl-anhydromuramyl-L-alanine amidase AmpD
VVECAPLSLPPHSERRRSSRSPAAPTAPAAPRRAARAASPAAARGRAAVAAALTALGLWAACAATSAPGVPLRRRGDEIVACGQLFHTGTPVVLWNDPGGYDAYRVWARFAGGTPVEPPAVDEKARYGPSRGGLDPDLAARVARDGWQLADLQRIVRQLVVHYDAAGTSRQCFKVLHDTRGLSAHFLLDVDGTIYQTLDLKERAWHAAEANDASIGIEIAHIGAFPSRDDAALQNWYRLDPRGPFVSFPPWLGDPGVRTPGFVPRPARPELIEGQVHDQTLYQYDFTEQQYRALAKLTATLAAVFPLLELRVPRSASGDVLDRAMTPAELAEYQGLLGHWHVTARKVDPGPAFDWDRVLAEAEELR